MCDVDTVRAGEPEKEGKQRQSGQVIRCVTSVSANSMLLKWDGRTSRSGLCFNFLQCWSESSRLILTKINTQKAL